MSAQPSTPAELLALIIRGGQPLVVKSQIEIRAAEAALPLPDREGNALKVQGRGPHSAPIWEWVDVLRPYAPQVTDLKLASLFEYALLGVAVGFADRSLSPYLAAHQKIVPLLLDDITTVYTQLQERQANYSLEELIFRAYDYGIHKAYYLDWTLYLSRDLY